MTLTNILTTFFGAALFPFLLTLFFDKFVKKMGALGGFVAVAVIIGSVWMINHGNNMIVQSGPIWVDMAFAAGSGVLVASYINKGNFKKALPNLFIALLGGMIAGAVISIWL
jgi:hypothetical protein